MNLTTKILVGIAILTSMSILSGCGKDDSVAPAVAPVAAAQTTNPYGNYTGQPVYGQGSCGAGLVFTTAGCLPQGSCPAGMGMYTNGGCFPAIAPNGVVPGYGMGYAPGYAYPGYAYPAYGAGYQYGGGFGIGIGYRY
jgi:hypothetical protein